jgi:hypothetical protein
MAFVHYLYTDQQRSSSYVDQTLSHASAPRRMSVAYSSTCDDVESTGFRDGVTYDAEADDDEEEERRAC